MQNEKTQDILLLCLSLPSHFLSCGNITPTKELNSTHLRVIVKRPGKTEELSQRGRRRQQLKVLWDFEPDSGREKIEH